ncbi:hypothetical protein ABPG74_011943 [Tetrahymena malaccensis]
MITTKEDDEHSISQQDITNKIFRVTDSGQCKQLDGEQESYQFFQADFSYQRNSQSKQHGSDSSFSNNVVSRIRKNEDSYQSRDLQICFDETLNHEIQIPVSQKTFETPQNRDKRNKTFASKTQNTIHINNQQTQQFVTLCKDEMSQFNYFDHQFPTNHYDKQNLNNLEDSRIEKYTIPVIWRKKFFKLLFLTNHLRFQVKKVLLFFRPYNLAENQLQAINDKSAQTFKEAKSYQQHNTKKYKPIKRSKLQKKFRNYYIQTKKKIKCIIEPVEYALERVQSFIFLLDRVIPLINPFSFFMMIWDFIIILLSIFNLLFIPYYICFIGQQEAYYITSFLQRISYIIYLVDVFVSMNTSNYVKGELVQERKKVIKGYFRKYLFQDVICLLCLFFDDPFNSSLLKMLFLFKMVKVGDLIEKNREFFQIDDKYSSLTNLILLMTKIIYLCHLFACFFYKIGRFSQSQGEQSWLDQLGDSNSQTLYINAIYYASVTITTVGYGDITPKSYIEKTFIVVMAFICCANFGYAMNQIGLIIQEYNEIKLQYRQNIATINKYMKERDVNKLLQSKVRKYFEYIYSESENFHSHSDQALSKLSSNLQLQIKKEINLRSLKNIPFLCSLFSNECLEKVALKINERSYGIGETIIDQNEIQKPTLYYITKGAVTISLKDQFQVYTKQFKQLKSSNVFGEYQFFSSSLESRFTYISSGITTVQTLLLEDLIQVLEEFPNEKEKFCYIKDRVQMYGKVQDIKVHCYSCKSSSHLLDKCPYLTYQPNLNKVIYQFRQQQVDFQKAYKRKVTKNFQTLSQLNDLQKQAESLIENLLDDEDSQVNLSFLQSQNDIFGQQKSRNNSEQLESTHNIESRQKSICNNEINQNMLIKVNNDGILQQQQQESSQRLLDSEKEININQELRERLTEIGGFKRKPSMQKGDEYVSQHSSLNQGYHRKSSIVLNGNTNLTGEQKEKQQELIMKNRRHSKLRSEDIQAQFLLQQNQQQNKNNVLEKKRESIQNVIQATQIQNNIISNELQQQMQSLFSQFLSEFKTIQNTQNKEVQRLSTNNEQQFLKSIQIDNDFNQYVLKHTSINQYKQQYIENLLDKKNNNNITNDNSSFHETYEMDTLKIFKYYFLHNNVDKVLREYYQKFSKNFYLQKEQFKKKRILNKKVTKQIQIKKL